MASPLWNAASEGDATTVNRLLDSSLDDIEIKNEDGATPLFEAVSKGHVEVVRTLLARGASTSNSPQLAQPEEVTSNTEILELLKNAGSAQSPSQSLATGDKSLDGMNNAYPPQPNGYPYYPTLNGPPVDGAAYFPPHIGQPHPGEQSPNGGQGHFPPPEIARMIPCRYFPACRYGPSCMFAHPQTPYYPPSMPPPGQYSAGYDPRAPPYSPSYYGVPQPSYPHTNGVTPMSPSSAPSHTPQHSSLAHSRSGSEVSPPPPGVPFSPSRIHRMSFSPVPPISPSAYPHPGPVPMGVPPLSLHSQAHTPSHNGPQSPLYSPPSSYPTRPNGIHAYAASTNGHPEANGLPPAPGPHGDGPHRGPVYRDGSGHGRRGGAFRRGPGPAVDKRKLACIFYPSGKCKNGEDCRFGHVLNDNASHQQNYHSGRGRRGGFGHTNGVSHVNEKLADMGIRTHEQSNRAPTENGHNRGRSMGGNHPKTNPPQANGVRSHDKKNGAKPQRVPQADEFPALAGSSTPRNRSPASNGSVNGSAPTAAQVLQRPPPQKGDFSRDSAQTRDPSPELVAQPVKVPREEKPVEPTSSVSSSLVHPVAAAPVKSIPSFASIASPAANIPNKELSVSA